MISLDPVSHVWGITGNLGGGKSLTAVSLAVHAMERGYFVVSNITLDCDSIYRHFGVPASRLYQHFSFESPDFDPFTLPCGSPRGSGGRKRVLVVLDECAEWIDQYSTLSNPRIKRFLSWLRHSSKRSQDVVLIVQRLEYLNKSIRILISKWVVVDDLLVYRLPVVRMRIPFLGGFCLQRVFDRNRRLVQGPYIVRKSLYGRFYRTAECLNLDGASICEEYTIPMRTDVPWVGFVFVYLLSLFVLFWAVRQLSYSIPSAPSALVRASGAR